MTGGVGSNGDDGGPASWVSREVSLSLEKFPPLVAGSLHLGFRRVE